MIREYILSNFNHLNIVEAFFKAAMWLILVNIPWELEWDVNSTVVVCKVFSLLIRTIWVHVLIVWLFKQLYWGIIDIWQCKVYIFKVYNFISFDIFIHSRNHHHSCFSCFSLPSSCSQATTDLHSFTTDYLNFLEFYRSGIIQYMLIFIYLLSVSIIIILLFIQIVLYIDNFFIAE